MAIFMPPPWRRPRGNQTPAFLRQAKRPPSPEGSTAFCKPVLAPGTGPPNYCGGGGGGGDVGIVGVLQLAFRRAGDEIAWGRGGPEHGTAGAAALRLVCSPRGRNRVGAKRRRIGRRSRRSVVVVVDGPGFPDACA